MAVVYDHAITGARRVVSAHRPKRVHQLTTCTAGCGRWPCKRFEAAFAVITRNSTAPALR